MKNHYDKIFLAVAFLLLLASVGYFVTGNSSLDSLKQKAQILKAQGSKGEKWESTEVKTNVSKTMSWRYPAYQDADETWLFQVFTPPRIWQDASGNFIASAPKIEIIKEKEVAVSQLELAAVTTGKYPVVLLGYAGSLYQFRDESDLENPIEFIGREGQDLSYKDPNGLSSKAMIDLGLKFLSAKKEKLKASDGSINEVTIVQIEDKKLGRTIELRTDGDTILPDQRKLILKSTIDDSKTFPVFAVGEVITYNGSKYKVEELSFENEFIVLAQVSEDSEILPATHRLTITKKVTEEEQSDSDEASKVE